MPTDRKSQASAFQSQDRHKDVSLHSCIRMSQDQHTDIILHVILRQTHTRMDIRIKSSTVTHSQTGTYKMWERQQDRHRDNDREADKKACREVCSDR